MYVYPSRFWNAISLRQERLVKIACCSHNTMYPTFVRTVIKNRARSYKVVLYVASIKVIVFPYLDSISIKSVAACARHSGHFPWGSVLGGCLVTGLDCFTLKVHVIKSHM